MKTRDLFSPANMAPGTLLIRKELHSFPFPFAFYVLYPFPLRVSLSFPCFVFPFRTHRSHHFENDVEHGQAGEEDEVGAGEGLVLHRGGEEH